MSIESIKAVINQEYGGDESDWYPEVYDFEAAHYETTKLFGKLAHEALLKLIQAGYVGIY